MNDPFDGVYQIKRSSAASFLLQIKWLIASQPFGKDVRFDTRGLPPEFEDEVVEVGKGAGKVEPASTFTAGDVKHLNQADETTLLALIDKHIAYTSSERAQAIRADWANMRTKFVKVMPNEYKRALTELAAAAKKEAA